MPRPPRPTSRQLRRRRLAVALVALLALVVGVALGAGSGEDGGGDRRAATAPGGAVGAGAATSGGEDAAGEGEAAAQTPAARARAEVARMPLERQVGQLLVISFSGTSAPAYVTDALRAGRAAGTILFGGNVTDAAGVRALTGQLQRAAGGDAVVALDQEGGDIRILPFAPPEVGQARQPTPADAAANARAAARALRGVGVNVTLGPVADVADVPGSFMAGRAYPGDAEAVGASVAAAVEAYGRAGIAATPKHFPGVGGATTNTDFGSASVGRSREEVVANELEPFRAAVEAGTPLIMTGHARYPAIDPDRIASQSHAVVTGLLRDELGFEGVAMTDSLEADAVDAATPGAADVGLAAVRALAAGNDLLLLTGPGSFPLAREALIARARRDPAFRARVAESAARVAALRATFGA